MSQIDLESLSVEELQSLSAKANNLIQAKEDKEIQAVYDQMVALAANVGKTLSEMAVWGGNKSRKRKAVPQKYRDPENEANTWTGRGMKPKWVLAKLEAGRKLEEFLI